MEVNEPCALGPDLERTDGRHAYAAASTGPLCVGPTRFLCRALIEQVRPTAAWTSSAPGTEAIRDLGYRNDGRVAPLDRLAVDMANAQAALEQFRDWGKGRRIGHDPVQVTRRLASHARTFPLDSAVDAGVLHGHRRARRRRTCAIRFGLTHVEKTCVKIGSEVRRRQQADVCTAVERIAKAFLQRRIGGGDAQLYEDDKPAKDLGHQRGHRIGVMRSGPNTGTCFWPVQERQNARVEKRLHQRPNRHRLLLKRPNPLAFTSGRS